MTACHTLVPFAKITKISDARTYGRTDTGPLKLPDGKGASHNNYYAYDNNSNVPEFEIHDCSSPKAGKAKAAKSFFSSILGGK